jgi:hypothetical protein
MNIDQDKLFWLHIGAGRKNDAVDLLNQGLKLKFPDKSQLWYLLHSHFYPEFASYTKSFGWSSGNLHLSFETLARNNKLYDIIKLFFEADLLEITDQDDNKFNILDAITYLHSYTGSSHVVKDDIVRCLDFLAEKFDLDYEEILLESFTSRLSNCDVIEYCLAKGATLPELSPETIESVYEKTEHLGYISCQRGIELKYLIDNHAQIGLDLKKLFCHVTSCNYAQDHSKFLLMFMDAGLILDSVQDIDCVLDWLCYANEEPVIKIVIESPYYNDNHKDQIITFLDRDDYDLEFRIKILTMLGIDLIEQLRQYCLDPNFEPEFDVENLYNGSELEKIMVSPFGYNTQREFELYLMVGCTNFAAEMIKCGFRPCFETAPEAFSFDTLVEIFDNNKFNPNLLPGIDITDYLSDAIEKKTFEQEINETKFTIVTKYQVQSFITKFKTQFEENPRDFIELLLSKTELKLCMLDAILDLTIGGHRQYDAKLSDSVHVCCEIIDNQFGRSQLKFSIVKCMHEAFVNVLHSQDYKADDEYLPKIAIKEIFDHLIAEVDIDLFNEVILPLRARYRYDVTSLDLILHFMNCDLLAFFEKQSAIDLVLDIVACPHNKPTVPKLIEILEALDQVGYINANHTKIFEVFIRSIVITERQLAFEFYAKVKTYLPDMDLLIVTILNSKSVKELASWFNNKSFAEYILEVCLDLKRDQN